LTLKLTSNLFLIVDFFHLDVITETLNVALQFITLILFNKNFITELDLGKTNWFFAISFLLGFLINTSENCKDTISSHSDELVVFKVKSHALKWL